MTQQSSHHKSWLTNRRPAPVLWGIGVMIITIGVIIAIMVGLVAVAVAIF